MNTKKIQAQTEYSLNEVAEMNLSQGANSHSTLYRLATIKDKEGKRQLCETTTKSSIRAYHKGKPWGKISGKLYIKGADLLLFKKLNNL